MGKYFQMDVGERSAEITIYGDITSWEWLDSDVSSYTLAKRLADLGDVDEITVRINSYGGEVAEGLAIFNALKSHKAKVTTVCDGMACSIASVVFMAGDERVMNEASLLMIHNAWSYASGDANDLRKEADALDAVTQPSKAIYLDATDLTEQELTEWMDDETWIDASTALERGFATRIEALSGEQKSQTARYALLNTLRKRGCGEAQRETLYDALKRGDVVGDARADEPEQGAEPVVEEAPEELDAPEFPDMALRLAQAYMDMQP